MGKGRANEKERGKEIKGDGESDREKERGRWRGI